MTEWDLLSDEPERPAGPDPASATASAWAPLDDWPSQDTRNGAASAWQVLDDVPHQAESARPAPELTASQLRTGEVLWARVDGREVVLGSGQLLDAPAGIPDGIGGWRRVRIIDAATLRAEVLLFPVEQPPQGVADEPTLLFPPDPAMTAPLRPAGFPVGEGGDLSAAFTARVRTAEQYHRQAATQAKEEFQHRGDQLERQLRGDYQRRIQTVEQQAEARYQQAVKRVEAEAGQRVDRAAQAAMQSQSLRQRAELERDKVASDRTLLVRAGAAGWIVAVILLLILVAYH